jgi:hypothetical protein
MSSITWDEVDVAPKIFGYSVLHHTESGQICVIGQTGYWETIRTSAGPIWPVKYGIVFKNKDINEVKEWLVEREVERLRIHDVSEAAADFALEFAKTLPYPQNCQCQCYPTGIANDCHVHNDNPKHFFGDIGFDCTCTENG